jgi:DNA end-binding protein Ku
MHAMSRDFRFEDLHDEYRRALEELVDAKLHGEQPGEIRRPRRAPAVDITKVLAESLAAAEAAHPVHEPEQAAKKTAAKKAPAKKTTPRRTG